MLKVGVLRAGAKDGRTDRTVDARVPGVPRLRELLPRLEVLDLVGLRFDGHLKAISSKLCRVGHHRKTQESVSGP